MRFRYVVKPDLGTQDFPVIVSLSHSFVLCSGNVYWLSIPPSTGFYYFMLAVSNLAAIIASQAVISGSFSIVRQVGWRRGLGPVGS